VLGYGPFAGEAGHLINLHLRWLTRYI